MDVAMFKRRDVEMSRRCDSTSRRYREGFQKFVHIDDPLAKKPSPLVNVTFWTCNAQHERILPNTCVRES